MNITQNYGDFVKDQMELAELRRDAARYRKLRPRLTIGLMEYLASDDRFQGGPTLFIDAAVDALPDAEGDTEDG